MLRSMYVIREKILLGLFNDNLSSRATLRGRFYFACQPAARSRSQQIQSYERRKLTPRE